MMIERSKFKPIGGPLVNVAGIPPKKQPSPQRTTQRYTEGTGFSQRPTATTATQPLLGPTGNVPNYPYIFGADFDESNQLAVSAMSAGVSRTVTGTVFFPDIPTLKLDPTDTATLLVVPQVWQNPIVAGLVIASVAWQPQALQKSSGQWVPGVHLQPGTVYTAFRVIYTIGLYAGIAVASANLNIGAMAEVIVTSL